MAISRVQVVRHILNYLIMLTCSEECVTKMEEETAVDNSGSITGNALLEKRYSTSVVAVNSLHNEPQVNLCKPILGILS